jgi:hypothetical protein
MFVSCERLCRQVEVSANGRSLVQRWCVSESDQVKIKQPRHLLWVGRRGQDYETKRVTWRGQGPIRHLHPV